MKQALSSSMPARAGRLVTQPGGFYAFIPNPLPPEPPIQRDDETDTLLSAADTNLGRLDGVASILPHPDLFVANVRALRGRFKLPDRKYTKRRTFYNSNLIRKVITLKTLRRLLIMSPP